MRFYDSASRISIYYINRWKCGTPNEISSSNQNIGHFWTMHSFSIEIMLDPKNLKVFKSYRKNIQGSNDPIRSLAQILHWTIWTMHFSSIEILLVPKNFKVYNPIGTKCKGQMNENNVLWFGVPHVHLLC